MTDGTDSILKGTLLVRHFTYNGSIGLVTSRYSTHSLRWYAIPYVSFFFLVVSSLVFSYPSSNRSSAAVFIVFVSTYADNTVSVCRNPISTHVSDASSSISSRTETGVSFETCPDWRLHRKLLPKSARGLGGVLEKTIVLPSSHYARQFA